MIFETGTSFDQALQSRRVKTLIPSQMTSREWRDKVSAELRERSFFSARVVNAEFLDGAGQLIDRIVAGVSPGPGQYMDMPTARLELKKYLQSIDYKPEATGIRDLSSDQRLNLIIDTNLRMAHGYGQFLQANDPKTIDGWPCQELLRIFIRRVPRGSREKPDGSIVIDDPDYWQHRWEEAGGELFANKRMIARKDSPVWEKISYFGLPYPPFDFNSGMGVLDVSRDEAVELGVIERDEKVVPQERDFNADLEMSADLRDERLKAALAEQVGDEFELQGDSLVRVANEFLEEDHPRDESGKFSPVGALASKHKLESIKRTGEGKKAKWQTSKGEDLPEHAKKLGIPPAWKEAHFNPDPKADLQAVGIDSKGRVQRVYSDAFTERTAAEKFSRNKELLEKREKVFAQNENNLSHENPKTREAAAAMKLRQQ